MSAQRSKDTQPWISVNWWVIGELYICCSTISFFYTLHTMSRGQHWVVSFTKYSIGKMKAEK